MAYLSSLTSGWPWLTHCMIFNPNNGLHTSTGLLAPLLVVPGHVLANWTLVDPGWSLHAVWPHNCVARQRFFFPYLFAKEYFEGNFTSGCPLNLGGVPLKSWPQASLAHSLLPYQDAARYVKRRWNAWTDTLTESVFIERPQPVYAGGLSITQDLSLCLFACLYPLALGLITAWSGKALL